MNLPAEWWPILVAGAKEGKAGAGAEALHAMAVMLRRGDPSRKLCKQIAGMLDAAALAHLKETLRLHRVSVAHKDKSGALNMQGKAQRSHVGIAKALLLTTNAKPKKGLNKEETAALAKHIGTCKKHHH